jgi:hypothetical protein
VPNRPGYGEVEPTLQRFLLRGLGVPADRLAAWRGGELELPAGRLPRSVMLLIDGMTVPCHLPGWAAGMARWELSLSRAAHGDTLLLNDRPLLVICNAMLHRRDLPREIPNLILDGRWFLPHTRALPFLLESIAGLESLTLLHFERLRDLSTLDGCAALRHLGLQAPALESLATMGRPPALRSIFLHDCGRLAEITPLVAQESLEDLRVVGCPRLRDLGPLAGQPALRRLMLRDCGVSDLGHLAGSEGLESLAFAELPRLRSVLPLQGLRGLRDLTVHHCPGLRNLGPVGEMRGLDRLDLAGFNGRRIRPVFRLRGLSSLHLAMNRLEDRDLFPIMDLQGLRELVLSGNTDLQRLDHLPALRQIANLRLEACINLIDMAFLRYMDELAELDLACSISVRGMETLGSCARLERLGLGWAGLGAQETGFLRELPRLRELSLAGWRGLRALDFARGLPRLQTLNVQDCPALTDLSALEQCPDLAFLACDEAHLAGLGTGSGGERLRELAVTSRQWQPSLDVFEDWNPENGLFDRIHERIVLETPQFAETHGRPFLDANRQVPPQADGSGQPAEPAADHPGPSQGVS